MKKITDKQISDVLAGVAGADVAREVAEWFATGEGQECLAQRFDRENRALGDGDVGLLLAGQVPSDSMLEEIERRVRRRRVRALLLRVAAVVLPLLLLASVYTRIEPDVALFGSSDCEEVLVPKGGRMNVMFQDGTTVVLNSGSWLRYPRKFGFWSRRVMLRGEAYFHVASNRRRPFIVELDGPEIKVKGTEFNVNAYQDDSLVTVRLDRGHVSMSTPSGNEVDMKCGQCLCYNRNSGFSSFVDAPSASAWKDNVLAFDAMPVGRIAKLLSRNYDVRVSVGRDVDKNLLITLRTPSGVPIDSVLRDIERIAPLRCSYDEARRSVRIMGRE